MSVPGGSWLLIPMALLPPLSACTLPTVPGPQLQEPPPGFYRVPDAAQPYRIFPERESIHYDVWVNAAWGDVSSVHINGYAGRLMRADVQDALESARAAMADSVTFSGLQEYSIDGRAGWGWTERMESPERGLVWIGLRVTVPYDTVSYTLELRSGDPAFKREPESLVAIASTFGVGEVTWNVPLIVGIVVVVVVVVRVLRKRSQERAERLRNIRFVEVPRPEEEKEKEGGGAG